MTRNRPLVIILITLIVIGVAGVILILMLLRPGSGSGIIQVPGPVSGTGPAPVLGPPVPTPGPDEPLVTLIPMPLVSTDEASATAGFPPVEPAFLPEGYFLAVRQAVQQEDGTAGIQSLYQDGSGAAAFVIVTQARYPNGVADLHAQITPGDVPVADVTVRGQPAVWAERAASSISPGDWQIVGVNTLLWQEGEFTYIVQSNTLLLDTMLAVAESLP